MRIERPDVHIPLNTIEVDDALENQEAHSTPLRELAEMDNLMITYKFKTSAGSIFHSIEVGPDKYSRF